MRRMCKTKWLKGTGKENDSAVVENDGKSEKTEYLNEAEGLEGCATSIAVRTLFRSLRNVDAKD